MSRWPLYVYGAFAFCCAFLVYKDTFSFWRPTNSHFSQPIAKIESLKGTIKLNNPQRESRPIKIGQSLYHLDHIETFTDSDLILLLSNQAKIRIAPNSKIILEKSHQQQSDLILRVLSGNYWIEQNPNKGKVRIFQNGKNIEIENIKKAKLKETTDSNLLQRDEIEKTLLTQRNLLDKCYVHFLRENPKMSGEVRLQFTIQSSGRVSNAKVQSSQIPEEKFSKCLVQVISGVRFRAFSGDSKTILYPFHFLIE